MKRIGWVRVAVAAVAIGVGGVAAHGADIEVYKAKEIEPVKPADGVKPAPQPDHARDSTAQPKVDDTTKDAAPPPAAAAGNLVEPLSNGLKLTMTMQEIQTAFGEPTEHTFDARTFGYPGFGVQCGGRRATIWDAVIKGPTKLHCGLGAGSTRADVTRLLGSPVGATVGQYKLTVTYGRDGRVDNIKIEPASEEFAPYEASATASQKGETKQATSDLAGTWWGNDGLLGQIELKSDGTWTSPNGAKGTYTADGDKVTFTGPLAAWNKGQATLTDGRLAFQWTNADGSKNEFSFSKR